MKHTTAVLLLVTGIFTFTFHACQKDPSANPYYEQGEENAGGANTVDLQSSNTFDAPSPALTVSELRKHLDGLPLFEGTFVTNPATVNGGLGPLFNTTGCEACHTKNGRAPFPASGSALGGLLLRLSVDGTGAHGDPAPVPGFGGQLQQKAVFGTQQEGDVSFHFEETTGSFSDGEVYSLRKPVFSIDNTYIPLPAGVKTSPRIAPPVFGLGLLEAVDEGAMLANADESDADGDGISGKANYVWDELNQKVAIGKFGWKANQPHIYQQTAGAFNGDMGITSALFPTESTAGQPQDDGLSDDPELSANDIELTAFYTLSLGAPKRRNADDATVLAGKKIFIEANCSGCHIPKLTTGNSDAAPFNSFQTIFPYTDLLLHDMGDGLADNREDFLATGKEWRTPPLWGIGLTEVVNGHTNFLHDGRARNLMEAIMWHGGEAEQSKQHVKSLSKSERTALLAFLKSL